MAKENNNTSRVKIFQTLALLLFLVGLPLGSWYYLKTGMDYRLQALEELNDHGQIPAFQLSVFPVDTLFTQEMLKGNFVVASFFSPEDEQLRGLYGENLAKLREQFADRPDLFFLQHIPTGADSLAIESFRNQYGFSGQEQVLFLREGKPGLEELAKTGYNLPLEDGNTLGSNPFIALADTSLTIRRFYDIREPEEIKRLVEHIAIILPPVKEGELVFKREIEK